MSNGLNNERTLRYYICHGYGVTDDGSLPPAEEHVLKNIYWFEPLKIHNFRIIISSWSKPPHDVREGEHTQKVAFLRKYFGNVIDNMIICDRDVDNTADEILAWTEVIRDADARGENPEIWVIAARFHFGLEYLWGRHLREQGLSHIPISFHYVGGKRMWGPWMPSWFQRGTLRWMLAGVIRTALYRLYGMKAKDMANHSYALKK